MEFLVYSELHLPHDMDPARLADLHAREQERGRELARAGSFKRMWRVPARRAVWTIFEAADATALHAIIETFPLYPWFDIKVYPLAAHPRDPGRPAT